MSAESKSIELLEGWLSPLQLDQYRKYSYFDVIGSHTKRRYRIKSHYTTNISVLDDNDDATEDYCIVPNTVLPIGDHILAQKIALETDERKTLRIVNGAELLIGTIMAIFFIVTTIALGLYFILSK